MKNKYIIILINVIIRIYNIIVGIKFSLFTDPTIRKCIKKNKSLKNSHVGESCFILGTGPSLKTVDFSRLSDKFVFSVNLLYKNPNFHLLNPNIHVFADSVFFKEDVAGVIIDDIEQFFLKQNVRLFLPIYTQEFIKKYDLTDRVNIYAPIKHYSNDFHGTIDLTKSVTDFGTVIFQCIQIAIYMGFKTVYLLGCDCTGIQKVLSNTEDNYCFKVDSYTQKAQKHSQNFADVESLFNTWTTIFGQYKAIERYTQNIGVKIYNLSNPTILDSIERKDINEVLK